MREGAAARRESLPARTKLTVAYYLATPLFALCDWVFHWNVRVAALDGHPAVKTFYYLICTGAGVVTYWKPSLAWAVGLAESSVNIFLLILGVMLPYWAGIGAFTGEQTFVPFTATKVLNFLISGFMWVNVFHRSIPGGGRGGRE